MHYAELVLNLRKILKTVVPSALIVFVELLLRLS